MGHYKSNLRDLEFNLFEVLRLDDVLATGQFGELSGDAVRRLLAAGAAEAEGPLAEAFFEGDRNPPTFDAETHSVTLPESFKESVRVWLRGGWLRFGLPAGIGGTPAPATVRWSINEFLVGGQPAAFFYLAGPPITGGPVQRRQ